ncbi:hypothetical protein BDR06DRAFT_1008788 [Suillus hirtellus]|nr:hypothetical protein BDR06DRAFT_1008788 [Suillus hirtellus]
MKLQNNFRNSKAGRRANAAGNTIVTKLIGGIMKKERKKSHPLKATEVYSKMYYMSHVQPVVKEELDAMKEASDAPDLKKCTIQVVWRQLASQWENETLEVKEEVASLIREMKDKREKDTTNCKILSKDLVISWLTEILLTFFSELYDSTGWAFSILLGGPDPANGGKLDACPKFEERVMVPYFEFASPEAAISLSQSKEGKIANNTPSDGTPATTSPANVACASSLLHTPDTSPTSLVSPSSPLHIPDTSLTSSPLHIPDTSLASSPLHTPDTSFTLWGQDFTPRDTLLANPPQEAVPAYNFFQDLLPNPQDNDEDHDLDWTILPMPPNY